MRISHFFIDRPIFASVVSIVFVILGAVAYFRLPVAQYPEIAPPIINVTGQYPGASAEVVASTVVAPIEEQINGVENMLYMSSNSTADGRFSIAVTFDLGTNLDIAQVQVQNRVAIAQPRLPAEVRKIGVTVTKSSPDLMMVVHLFSPDKSRDTLFISNYATLEIKDVLTRVDGVGSITVFGSRDYAMRVWLDPGSPAVARPDRRRRHVWRCRARTSRSPPACSTSRRSSRPGAFQVAVQTLGRLADPDEFANIVVKQTPTAVVRLQGRREGRARGAGLFVEFLSRPRSRGRARGVPAARLERAVDRARPSARPWTQLSKRFPPGVEVHDHLRSDPVHPAIGRRGEDDHPRGDPSRRAGRHPVPADLARGDHSAVAIPVSLIGTFFFMAMFGFTLNNLSLFGLVLAVGIVVDDAIVVVENVERNIAAGLTPRDAAIKSMDEVGAALIAIALVLCAVFVPAAFITGISGQFYRQFALTIAGATIISLIVSLTLSPAMCALLLKPHTAPHAARWWERPLRGFFGLFNRGFERWRGGYGWLAARVVRFAALDARGLCRHPRLRPQRVPQDAGRLHSRARSRLSDRRRATAARRFAGAHRRGQPARRRDRAQDAGRLVGGQHRRLFRRDLHQSRPMPARSSWCSSRSPSAPKDPAQVGRRDHRRAVQAARRDPGGADPGGAPPPVQGIGNAGGFRMMVEDRAGRGPQALQEAVAAMMAQRRGRPPA